MAMIRNNSLFLALVLSGLVHGLLLHYSAEDAVVDASEIQSATVQVELMQHVVTAPVVKQQPQTSMRNEVVADVDGSSTQVDEPSVAGSEELPVQVAVANDNNHQQFASLLHQAIDKHKRYPYQAKRQHRAGLVKLQFVVHPDGQVTDVSVVESSRFDVLDEAARDAVNAISPFQLAENYINEQKSYDVDIDFRLN
jgi:TonB family protein